MFKYHVLYSNRTIWLIRTEVENNLSDFGSVLLALLEPLRGEVDKRYDSCSTEMTAILGVKMYSILTAIVSCFCFCCIFFFPSTSEVEIYRPF